MFTKYLYLLFFLLLSCISQRDVTTNLIKTAKLQITFFNDSTHTDSLIEIAIDNKNTNEFVTGLKNSFLRQESCPINGRLRYLDKVGNIILEGLFSQEYQSLFVSLNGKKKTCLFSSKANSLLIKKNPFIKKAKEPTGVLGVISLGNALNSDKRFFLEDLNPENFKVCTLLFIKRSNLWTLITRMSTPC